jgi:hypothetical protein
MRQLFFDIDGSLLRLVTGEPKPALANGRFEDAIRRVHVRRLVCVGNFCHVVRLTTQLDPGYDGLGMVFKLCQGVFKDEEWFRSVTTLIDDPEHRAAAVDLASDWWYLDDLAEHFFAQDGCQDTFRNELSRRICVPEQDGTGDDVLRWVAGITDRLPEDGRCGA